jgi:bifunctional polynucleotide phosphatase/kinase
MENTKIAIFDVDWTLIKPLDGRTFPKDVNDWTWLRDSVPSTVKYYCDMGFKIVFLTDQTKPWKLTMIDNVIKSLGIVVTLIVSMEKYTNKPCSLLFATFFCHDFEKAFDHRHSFMVGDAAGRKSDWSSVDKDFAEDVGIRFFVPEEIFVSMDTNYSFAETKSSKEVIIMVGYQGSGKSTIAHDLQKKGDYKIISGDVCKTIAKTISEAKKYVNTSSIIFDATNGTKERREILIEFAQRHDLPIRCLWLNVSIDEAIDRVKQREMNGGCHVPKIALYTFRKRFEEPNEDEGFDLTVL